MQSPLPDLDLTNAQVIATIATAARKHIPGFFDCWLTLESGDPLHIRFGEVRGILDQGIAGSGLSQLEEVPRTKFATSLEPAPVYEKSLGGRIFRFMGPPNYRGISACVGEVVASTLKIIDQPSPPPEPVTWAGPIPWDSAIPLLISTRLLGIYGTPDGLEIRVGSPRGEYGIRPTGLRKLEEQGFPGDRGIGAVDLKTSEIEQATTLTLSPPTGKGAPVVLVAEGIKVHKVNKVKPATP
ncbi:MAG: hypothetical protein ABI743_11340 [bacterium]